MRIGPNQPEEQKEQRKQSPPRNKTKRAGKTSLKQQTPIPSTRTMFSRQWGQPSRQVCPITARKMLSHPVKDIRIHNDRPITQDAVQWQICHAHNTIELILPEYPEVRVWTHMTRAIQAQTGSANVPILPIPSCHRYPASSEGKCQTNAHENKWPEAQDCVLECWQPLIHLA